MELVSLMEKLGFTWSEDQVQTYIRKSGPFEGTGNFIFTGHNIKTIGLQRSLLNTELPIRL